MDELNSIQRTTVIGVIGAGSCSGKDRELAEAVGRHIATTGNLLVCGGLGGVMEAAAKGAKDAGGVTIGILPGDNKDAANRYIDVAIATGMGEARNIIIIKTSDAVIALPGKYGTLSEMAFAMKIGKPIVSLSNWEISEDIFKTDDPETAVNKALDLMGEND